MQMLMHSANADAAANVGADDCFQIGRMVSHGEHLADHRTFSILLPHC